jgi:tetratricopeptide (TPR) repeat protein
MSPQRQRAKPGAYTLIFLLSCWLGRGVEVRAQLPPVAPPTADGGPAPTISPTYQALVSEGKALLKAEKLDAALAKFSAAVAQAEAESLPAPALANLYCLYGLAQGQAGAAGRPEALATLAKSVALDGSNPDCRLELAKLQLAEKQYEQAQRSARAVLTQADSDPALASEANALLTRAEVLGLFFEARQQLKAQQAETAAQRLQQAIIKAKDSDLAAEERALLHYVRALALRESGDDEQAVREVRAALEFTPGDADIHLELAKALFDLDQFGPASQSAEQALRLGLGDADDQRAATKLAKRAKNEALRERLSFYGSVSFGYDSNVLQGSSVQTVGDRSQSSAFASSSPRTARQTLMADCDPSRASSSPPLGDIIANYPEAVRRCYATPTPSVAEWDLPITVQLDLSGRLFRVGKLETWLGYQFYQYLMTSVAYDHDAYNRQDHTIPLLLTMQPVSWLLLRPHLDAFFSFTGLRSFAPYQGGLFAVLDVTFIEGRMLRTRLLYQHQLRRSFDRSNDAYLDADRDEVKITQELHLRGKTLGLRGQLSYRLRSERISSFSSSASLSFEVEDMMTTTTRSLGTFSYRSPLGYLGHEVATRFRLSIPWSLELLVGASFEYRTYSDDFTATFSPTRITFPCPRGASFCMPGSQVSLPSSTNFPTLDMPAAQRIDKTAGFELAATKTLPQGFGLEISYSLLFNFSTIANYIDNRNFRKHQVTLAATYTF